MEGISIYTLYIHPGIYLDTPTIHNDQRLRKNVNDKKIMTKNSLSKFP